MLYTYVNMYIAFVTPLMDVRDRGQVRPGLKMGVENSILVRLRFGEPDGNHREFGIKHEKYEIERHQTKQIV